MLISQNCFFDTEIKSIIHSLGKKMKCDICGAVDYCIDSKENNDEWEQIKDYLVQIREIYSEENILPKDFPESKKSNFAYIFSKEWRVVNNDLSEKQVTDVLKAFFDDDFDEKAKFGNRLVIDGNYLKENAILRDSSWDDFVQSLKHKNRFHSNFFNERVLERFCRCFQKYIPAKTEYFRGRISQSESGLTMPELEAPSPEFATAGRANSEGISRLYLADSVDTVLREIRAGVFDFVSIAKFSSKRTLSVVDFSALDIYSPFSMEIDMSVLAINKENLDNINKELGRPMRRSDNLLDYVPTQYLVDFIASIEGASPGTKMYDGVMYKSVMNPGGVNLAIFDKVNFEQLPGVNTLKINSVAYNV